MEPEIIVPYLNETTYLGFTPSGFLEKLREYIFEELFTTLETLHKSLSEQYLGSIDSKEIIHSLDTVFQEYAEIAEDMCSHQIDLFQTYCMENIFNFCTGEMTTSESITGEMVAGEGKATDGAEMSGTINGSAEGNEYKKLLNKELDASCYEEDLEELSQAIQTTITRLVTLQRHNDLLEETKREIDEETNLFERINIFIEPLYKIIENKDIFISLENKINLIKEEINKSTSTLKKWKNKNKNNIKESSPNRILYEKENTKNLEQIAKPIVLEEWMIKEKGEK
eukprot:GHVP01040232.1.p1 GENE.GHVP01040232.1~~GHVP01040232.1.p1  ORF type:complete len:283 (+),score=52.32 GHVP01040232.1:303-1151(+)